MTSRTHLLRLLVVASAIAFAIDACEMLVAQQPPAVKGENAPAPGAPAANPQSPAKAVDSTTEPKSAPAAKEEHKKQLVTVGMLLLVGVSLLGLVLIGMTIAWGGRLRKLARKPLPQQSPVDELWYLKAKKAPAAAGDDGAKEGGPAQSPPESP